jgi:hypothetical protein
VGWYLAVCGIASKYSYGAVNLMQFLPFLSHLWVWVGTLYRDDVDALGWRSHERKVRLRVHEMVRFKWRRKLRVMSP